MEQDEFSRSRRLWEKTGDPRHVWRVITTCLRGEASMPSWAENYLIDVATGIGAVGDDIGRELHAILKFPQKKGGPLRQIDSMTDEQFGIEFIRQILKGNTSRKARRAAAEAAGLSKEGKELPQRLKDFFGIKKLPDGNEHWQWKLIVAVFLINNPAYWECYDLPTDFEFPGGRFTPPPG